jgi:hypothetical protein
MSNYVDQVARALSAKLPTCEPGLIRLYALLILAKGASTTAVDVHDAWSLWRTQTAPDHHSIVPFGELTPEVQALDDRYVDAIHEVAVEMAGAR